MPISDKKALTVRVREAAGLHSRPCAKIIRCVQDFNVPVWLEHKNRVILLDSLLEIISLRIAYDDEITFLAQGSQSELILTLLKNLIESPAVLHNEEVS